MTPCLHSNAGLLHWILSLPKSIKLTYSFFPDPISGRAGNPAAVSLGKSIAIHSSKAFFIGPLTGIIGAYRFLVIFVTQKPRLLHTSFPDRSSVNIIKSTSGGLKALSGEFKKSIATLSFLSVFK